MNKEEPKFIDIDAQRIINEIKHQYEELTGRTLSPTQPEMLILNIIAYRELLLRIAIQHAAIQNLVSFSTAPVLDYLAELVGVRRLAPTRALTTLNFHLSDGHSGVLIPAGTRVQTKDGNMIFYTTEEKNVPSGVNNITIIAEADESGEKGNGYLPGDVSVLIDVLPFVVSVQNITVTNGGKDEEDDEHLRIRIKEAPNSYSTAGSKGAYKFHAMSAHQSIVDVAVFSPEPGVVNIVPLVSSSYIPSNEIKNAILQACSDERVRPLTDTVLIIDPNIHYYSIRVKLITYKSEEPIKIKNAVIERLNAFTASMASKLGNSILSSRVISEIMQISGVYHCILYEFTDIIIDETKVAVCNLIDVQVIGSVNG